MGNKGNRYSGLWQRLLIAVPGEPVDTLTRVDWLQGPSLFVDLRLGRSGLEAFAGQFRLSGDEAEWAREIDYRPTGLTDRGRLEDHGELLIERGLEADYIEYWQREAGTEAGVWATRLSATDGEAILVRCGNRFGFALGGEGLPEVSTGTVTANGWRIERSTLPTRIGTVLTGCRANLAWGELVLAVADAAGEPILRPFQLHDTEGTPHFEPLPRPGDPSATPASPLPVIDISALGSGDASAEASVVAAIRKAAAEVGFFAITGHGIAPTVGERMQAAAQAFFAQPLDTKMACYIGQSTNHRGYVPEGEEQFMAGLLDRKEAFDLALDLPEDSVPPGHPMLGPNQWPALEGFREDVMAWYAAAFSVGRRMLRGFGLALGQPPELLLDKVTTPPSQLRLIHYPFQPGIEDAPGIGAHTDYECFTLLSVTGPGLQVMTQAGEWIDVPPIPGALLVNIGDMFEFWSGGAFVATSHRVRKVPEERYSFPLFFALDYDVELRPLDGTDPEQSIHTGEHLFAQTAQTFRYLKERLQAGAVAMPGEARPLSSFGQEAQHRHSHPA